MDLTSTFTATRQASLSLLRMTPEHVNELLCSIADEAEAGMSEILAENAKDLSLMSPDDPKYDRLKLTEQRIWGIAADIRHVAQLPSPLVDLEHRVLPNGLKLTKRAVPFGVIGVIYEARPNVSFDVASLCLKSGNACILKGGSDADCSNRAIVAIIRRVLEKHGVAHDAVTLLPKSHEATSSCMRAAWSTCSYPAAVRRSSTSSVKTPISRSSRQGQEYATLISTPTAIYAKEQP